MSTLSIKIPNSIHQHAKRFAADEGISLSQLISSAVGEKLSVLETIEHLEQRAKRGTKVDIAAILAKIPAVVPSEPKDRKK